ncbi:MAG: hypothetical protein AMXMBFR77_14810 [Phycisphaerales bacterium]|nr:MAG: hypothetical protein BroJett004_13940 [Planctomycetota bacterium]
MSPALSPRAQSRVWDCVLVVLPGIVLGAAGVAKLLELDAFARAITSRRVIPRGTVDAIAVLVPSLELAAAIGCFHTGWFGPLLGATVVAAFTGAYTVEYALSGPPECGCFGAFATFQSERSSAGWVIGRNAFLVGCFLCGLLLRQNAATVPRNGG